MLYTEFNLEEAKEVWQQEAEKKARLQIAYSFLGQLDDEVIAEKTKLTLEEIRKLKEQGI